MCYLGYHGYQGPVKITDAEETPKITEALLKAAQDIGETITDVNGKEQKGEPLFFTLQEEHSLLTEP